MHRTIIFKWLTESVSWFIVFFHIRDFSSLLTLKNVGEHIKACAKSNSMVLEILDSLGGWGNDWYPELVQACLFILHKWLQNTIIQKGYNPPSEELRLFVSYLLSLIRTQPVSLMWEINTTNQPINVHMWWSHRPSDHTILKQKVNYIAGGLELC